MTIKAYIAWMNSIFLSVWFFTDFAELLKVYVITASVLTSAIITVIFHWRRLRESIVREIVVRVMMQPDIQKLINERLRQVQFRQRVKEAAEQARKEEEKKK